MTSDGTRTFEWDARNQLVAVTVGTHRSEFSYDGERRRVGVIEKENGVTQSDNKVVWCDQEICEERAADGTTVTRRVFERPEQAAGVARFWVEDHLGSVEGVTDGTSAVLTRYAFDPWGRRTVTAGSDTTSTGYTGHRWQSSANVILALYRAYDPELGRWLSEDPAGQADGLNLAVYVRGNPVTYNDELGLLRTVGFSGKDQKDVDEAIKRIKEKTECSNDCAGNQKEKLRRLLNDPGAILKYNPKLKECGKTGLATVLRLNKTFSIGPKAWNCCRNPVDPIDSLASTIAHELAHHGSGRHAYDMELKCFGCEGR
jgi:RHS repeat-associated protein